MAPKRPRGASRLPRAVADGAPEKPDPAGLYAALDLGTNSCRMLIAQPKGNQFHVIDSFSKSVQLGQGLERSGRLSRAAMRRTAAALKICRSKLDRHEVARYRLVATEACRRAINGAEFLSSVERETGLKLEVIEPEEEARLAVVSCAPLVSAKTEQVLVVDIGGGSTEFVWIDISRVPKVERPRALMRLHTGFAPDPASPFPAARVVDWISVPLGVATLRDQFNDVEDDAARFALMSWYFEENLSEFTPYEAEQTREGFQVIGTSGTVTTVAASHLGLRRYDLGPVVAAEAEMACGNRRHRAGGADDLEAFAGLFGFVGRELRQVLLEIPAHQREARRIVLHVVELVAERRDAERHGNPVDHTRRREG